MDKKEKITLGANDPRGIRRSISLVYGGEQKDPTPINLFKHSLYTTSKDQSTPKIETPNSNKGMSYYESDLDNNISIGKTSEVPTYEVYSQGTSRPQRKYNNAITDRHNKTNEIQRSQNTTSTTKPQSNSPRQIFIKKKYSDLNSEDKKNICSRHESVQKSEKSTMYNTFKKIFIIIIAGLTIYYYLNASSANPSPPEPINLCTISQSEVCGISRLYRFGLFRRHTTNIDNVLMENSECVALENRSNAYIQIQFKKKCFVKKIGIYHPLQANSKSAIREFAIRIVDSTEPREIECAYTSAYGYQEYNVDAHLKAFMIRVKNNHGEKYISIYGIYAFGYC